MKGRDLYDYIFYISRGVKVNRRHLRERLLQSGHIDERNACTLDEIKQMLCERFNTIDFEHAKEDVAPFIKDTTILNLWCADFFKQITEILEEKKDG